MSKKKKTRVLLRKNPKTKLRFNEYLGNNSVLDLAKIMGVTYTQLYPYTKPGCNPTLLVLEQIAKAFSKLNGKEIKLKDLID